MKYFCTVYDIQDKIPQLWSAESKEFTEPIGKILNNISIVSSEIRNRLSPYLETDLNAGIIPYLTEPVANSSNVFKNTVLRMPTLLITDSTSIEADAFVVTYTDETAFNVTRFLGSSLGSGTKVTDFTSSNGLFTIPAANWDGTTNVDESFIFSYQTHEDTLRELAAFGVGCRLLGGRFVSEAASTFNSLQTNYCSLFTRMIKDIIDGDILLECTEIDENVALDSRETWQGYNVDSLGIERTPYDNTDYREP